MPIVEAQSHYHPHRYPPVSPSATRAPSTPSARRGMQSTTRTAPFGGVPFAFQHKGFATVAARRCDTPGGEDFCDVDGPTAGGELANLCAATEPIGRIAPGSALRMAG